MLISNCCCQDDPPQCIFLDHFEVVDLRYEDVDFEGNDSSADFVVDTENAFLDSFGSGSYTLRLAPNPPDYILAETLVSDNSGEGGGSGSGADPVASGVTIRRADSEENIWLVRKWDVTDGYELRLGDSTLATFTATGDARVRLRLERNGSGGWDALCSAGTPLTLQHTETDIAFTKPDELNVGVIAEGGGEFDYLRVSPCPIDGSCKPVITCANVLLPLSWTFTVPTLSHSQGEECRDESGVIGGDPCESLGSGDWTLVNYSRHAEAIQLGDFGAVRIEWGTVDDLLIDFPTPNTPASCLWASAGLNLYPCGNIWDRVSSVDGIPAEYVIKKGPPIIPPRTGNIGSCTDCSFNIFGTLGSFPSQFVYLAFIQTEKDSNGTRYRARIVLHGGFSVFDSTEGYVAHNVTYISGFTAFHDIRETIDLTQDDLVVNKDSEFGLCDGYPSSLTLTPNGAVDDINSRVSGCGDTCEPFLNPVSADRSVVTGQIGGDDYCGFMSATFNEETLSWGFEGLMNYTDSDDGVLKQFTVRIECVELDEGEGRNWRLFVDSGTDTTVLDVDALDIINGDAFSLDFSGMVVVDGESQALTGIAGECDEENHPMAPLKECCPSLNVCCFTGITAIGDAGSCGLGGATDCGDGESNLTYDDTKNAFVGAFPISVPGQSGLELRVSCGDPGNGDGFLISLYDSSGNHIGDYTGLPFEGERQECPIGVTRMGGFDFMDDNCCGGPRSNDSISLSSATG